MSTWKCLDMWLGGPGLTQDAGASPERLGIAQLHHCFSQSLYPILARGMYVFPQPRVPSMLAVMCYH